MQVEHVGIHQLLPDPRNKRLHTDEGYLAVRESLFRFGQVVPIVIDQNNIIVKGNGTWHAAKELGWDKIWAIRTAMVEYEAELYAAVDNRTGELSEWDYKQLSLAIQANPNMAKDLGTMGFGETMLAPLRLADWTKEQIEDLAPPATDGDPNLEPVLFYDFDEKDMAVVAAAIARYRASHPAAEGKTDQQCMMGLLAWYVARPRGEL